MNNKKNIKSFLREEDGRTIKKSLLISSLGLITGFAISNRANASVTDIHSSSSGTSTHTSTHSNHSNHASY